MYKLGKCVCVCVCVYIMMGFKSEEQERKRRKRSEHSRNTKDSVDLVMTASTRELKLTGKDTVV